jgi:hypothetical protein
MSFYLQKASLNFEMDFDKVKVSTLKDRSNNEYVVFWKNRLSNNIRRYSERNYKFNASIATFTLEYFMTVFHFSSF